MFEKFPKTPRNNFDTHQTRTLFRCVVFSLFIHQKLFTGIGLSTSRDGVDSCFYNVIKMFLHAWRFSYNMHFRCEIFSTAPAVY